MGTYYVCSARRQLAEVVTPLLELISEATGLTHLELMGGSSPKSATDKYCISVVHYGTTNETVPRDFFEFDRDGFRANVLGHFCKFLSMTSGATFSHLVFYTFLIWLRSQPRGQELDWYSVEPRIQ